MRIALYQPDIAQNVGTIFRMSACLGIPIEIIDPCGFPFDDRKFRRASMDYFDAVTYQRHLSWEHFKSWQQELKPKGSRLVLLSSHATESFYDFSFNPEDVLLFGRESAGVPKEVAESCDCRVTIPMQPGMRSLNLAISASMVTAEALRQTR
jgi:tRNA (cytidine/uridine-2'-O-)-methyltransferase